jgi:hypothetical protein
VRAALVDREFGRVDLGFALADPGLARSIAVEQCR